MQDREAGALRRGLGGLPLTPRIKCIPQVQWRRGWGGGHGRYCRGAPGPALTKRAGGRRGDPTAPGLSNPQDQEGRPRQKTRLLSQQMVQASWVAGEEEGEEGETSRVLPCSFQCPKGTSRGPHQGPALEPQPCHSPVCKTLCGGDPQRGPLWSAVRGGPQADNSRGAGGRMGVFACRCGRERGAEPQTTPTQEAPGHSGRAAAPRPGPALACRPVGELGGEGSRTSRRCPSLRG